MTKYAYIGSTQLRIDTARDVQFVLTGQRNESKERPAEAIEAERKKVFEKGPKLTDEQQDAIRIYKRRQSSGYFGMGALDWYETQDQAQTAQASFPDFINFRIIPVDPSIR